MISKLTDIQYKNSDIANTVLMFVLSKKIFYVKYSVTASDYNPTESIDWFNNDVDIHVSLQIPIYRESSKKVPPLTKSSIFLSLFNRPTGETTYDSFVEEEILHYIKIHHI